MRMRRRIVASNKRMESELGSRRRNGLMVVIEEEQNIGVFIFRCGSKRNIVERMDAVIIFFISRC